MFDLDKWQEIFMTMRKNKLRTVLTALGVFWGIFMLVFLLGAGQGFQNGVVRQFEDEAINSFWIWSGKTSIPSHGIKPGRTIEFNNADLEVIAREVEEVDLIAPRNGLWGEYTINYGNKTGAFRINGSTGDFMSFNGEKLKYGRLLNESDNAERRKIVVLGEKAKEVLFGKDSTGIGEYVEIQGVFFMVVGVYNSEGNNGRNEERGYIPFSTLQNTFGQQNQVGLIGLTTKPGAEPKVVEQKIRKILARTHKFAPEDQQAVGLNSNEENFKSIMNVFIGIKIFVWVVGIMTLIAGIVGVSNIMLIIVKERTKEIGVRKAIGATPFSIVSLIIQESVVITALSGYFGLLVAAGVLELMRWAIDQAEASGGRVEFFYRPEVNVEVALAAIVVLVVAGALAGLMPALKAARVKPIEALRAD
ncbi:MAG: ABC transporter permease [Microscillaceae bacterium]|nr:ABC transporter permease [Microscillaceae bacterium]